MALRQREALHRRPGIEFSAQLLENLEGACAQPSAVDHAAPRWLGTQKDILGHGEGGDETELLLDHADAGPVRVARTAEQPGLAADGNAPTVRYGRSCEHAHERGFAGAIFAHQPVHRARDEVDRDIGERGDAAVADRDAARRQRGRGVSHGVWSSTMRTGTVMSESTGR